MTNSRTCRQHRRRNCQTCAAAGRSATSTGATATDADLWLAVSTYDSGSCDTGSYDGGSSCGGD